MASTAAAVGGAVTIYAVLKWYERQQALKSVQRHISDAQSLLDDCYAKIRDMESRLPNLEGGIALERHSSRKIFSRRGKSKGGDLDCG